MIADKVTNMFQIYLTKGSLPRPLLPPLSKSLPSRPTFRPQVHNTGNKVLDGPGQRLGKEFDRNFLRAFFLAGPHF